MKGGRKNVRLSTKNWPYLRNGESCGLGCSLALPTRITARCLDVATGIPVSTKRLTAACLMCVVSAKLLITDVSHGAGVKWMRAYIQVVHTWPVLMGKVDFHWHSTNSDGTRCTSC